VLTPARRVCLFVVPKSLVRLSGAARFGYRGTVPHSSGRSSRSLARSYSSVYSKRMLNVYRGAPRSTPRWERPPRAVGETHALERTTAPGIHAKLNDSTMPHMHNDQPQRDANGGDRGERRTSPGHDAATRSAS